MPAPSRRVAARRFAAALTVLALVAGACSSSGTAPQPSAAPTTATPSPTTAPRATPPPPPTTTATSGAAMSTTTTSTSTTTTTTLPPWQRLRLTAEPTTASATLVGADGVTVAAGLPFDGYVRGPVTVTLDADGFAPLNEQVEAGTGRVVHLWLDRPGQLLHKTAAWDTGAAPKQVAFTPDGGEVWVTLLGGDGFEVYDPASGDRLAAVDLPDAGSVEVIFNADGTRAYVSQMETASVYEVDVASRRVLRRLDTGGVWTKVMALSPDGLTLWASNWVSNDVSEIDLATGEVRARFRTVTTPRGLYVTPDGAKLYVAGFEHGEIEVFDVAGRRGRVIYRSGGSMRHLVGDPATGLIYGSDMSRRNVVVINPATDEVAVLARVDRTPNTIDLSPDGRVLYVSCRGRNNPETYLRPGPEWGSVVVLDTATGDYLDAIVGGNQTTGLDVSADGTMLAYSDFLDDRVTVYRIPSYEVLAAGGGGRWEAHLTELSK